MTKIINLRQARKQRARDDKRSAGDANAAKFGEAKPLRDARQAEATHCYVCRRWQDVIGMYPPAAEVLDHRMRMNTFLGKWLQYLAESGHGVATLRRIEGAPEAAEQAGVIC